MNQAFNLTTCVHCGEQLDVEEQPRSNYLFVHSRCEQEYEEYLQQAVAIMAAQLLGVKREKQEPEVLQEEGEK